MLRFSGKIRMERDVHKSREKSAEKTATGNKSSMLGACGISPHKLASIVGKTHLCRYHHYYHHHHLLFRHVQLFASSCCILVSHLHENTFYFCCFQIYFDTCFSLYESLINVWLLLLQLQPVAPWLSLLWGHLMKKKCFRF